MDAFEQDIDIVFIRPKQRVKRALLVSRPPTITTDVIDHGEDASAGRIVSITLPGTDHPRRYPTGVGSGAEKKSCARGSGRGIWPFIAGAAGPLGILGAPPLGIVARRRRGSGGTYRRHMARRNGEERAV